MRMSVEEFEEFDLLHHPIIDDAEETFGSMNADNMFKDLIASKIQKEDALEEADSPISPTIVVNEDKNEVGKEAESGSMKGKKLPSVAFTDLTGTCTESSAASVSTSVTQSTDFIFQALSNEIRNTVAQHLDPKTDKFKLRAIRTKSRSLKFPVKLMYTLQECSALHNGCVSWTDDGKAFVIVDPEKFELDVLPSNFKDAKFKSFLRKLYRWGFSKKIDERNSAFTYTYIHPKFQRGNYSLCMEMACNSNSHYIKTKPRSSIHIPGLYDQNEFEPIPIDESVTSGNRASSQDTSLYASRLAACRSAEAYQQELMNQSKSLCSQFYANAQQMMMMNQGLAPFDLNNTGVFSNDNLQSQLIAQQQQVQQHQVTSFGFANNANQVMNNINSLLIDPSSTMMMPNSFGTQREINQFQIGQELFPSSTNLANTCVQDESIQRKEGENESQMPQEDFVSFPNDEDANDMRRRGGNY